MPAPPDIQQIVSRVRSVVGGDNALLHQPLFDGNELRYVQECVDTGWVSSAGSFVTRLEEHLCRFTGAAHAVAVVNGTAALHIALMLTGVERDTEVLMPSLTFVATANAAAHCGAIPHFCDVNIRTLGIDAGRLESHLSSICELRPEGCINHRTGRRISALVPMHTFGHPSNMNKLMEVAAKWRIPIVEDAAESLGSYYRDRHTGTFGTLGILSFNGNKTVTTGAGGAIITNDEALARHARHITTTAKVPHRWEYVHDEVGYNYRMPNLNAALGCAQLERVQDLIDRKRHLARRYQETCSDLPGISVFVEPPECRSNYWLNALVLDRADFHVRDALLAALNDAGLQSRPIWRPLHQLRMYCRCPAMYLSVTEDLAGRIVNVPSSPGLEKSTTPSR
jgi:aminotransferase in exopolysaccharide biosynthesis